MVGAVAEVVGEAVVVVAVDIVVRILIVVTKVTEVAGAVDVTAEELGLEQVVDVERVGEALANAKVVVEVVRDIEELDDVVLVADGIVI